MDDFNKVLKQHERYIRVLANSYGQNDSDIIKDLIQEGEIGLFEAYKLFKPELGNKLISFAIHYIRGRQMNYLTEYGRTIRLPSNKVKQEKEGKFQSTTTTISIDTVSYFENQGDTATLKDLLASDDTAYPIDNSILYIALNQSKLTDREKDIILMHFGLEPYDKKHLFNEIGIKYDLSRERIRQIFEKGMDKLRNNKDFTRVAKEFL